ncbi:MAG TPA: hypothetical protein VGI45_27300 [Terracidiphilus sp.]|jgi:hypothetical protein
MRNKITSFAAAALLALPMLGASIAAAQTDQRVKVDIPFAFQAGNKQLPAGMYVIGMYRRDQSARVTTSDGIGEVLMLANVVGPGDRTDARLVFDRVGDSYLLKDVEAPGLAMTFGVEKAEQRLEASNSRSKPTTVTVAAVRL